MQVWHWDHSHLSVPAAPSEPALFPSRLDLRGSCPLPTASQSFSLKCGLPWEQLVCPLDPADVCEVSLAGLNSAP